jgi:hypothetical protein
MGQGQEKGMRKGPRQGKVMPKGPEPWHCFLPFRISCPCAGRGSAPGVRRAGLGRGDLAVHAPDHACGFVVRARARMCSYIRVCVCACMCVSVNGPHLSPDIADDVVVENDADDED